MTVYSLTGPHVDVQGPIGEVLGALILVIESGEHYWVDEFQKDLNGIDLVDTLIRLQDDAEPLHTYVEHVTFRHSLDGRSGVYQIRRVDRMPQAT